jgi:4-oxalocrotonate tautomerase
MPVKTIQITRGGTSPEAGSVTPEQKAALIKGASELMLDVLGTRWKRPSVIGEEDTENWS